MPDDQAQSSKPSRHRKSVLSIRTRLIILAFLAIAPLMFERVHGLQGARAKRAEQASAEVIDLVRRGVEAQREVVYSVRAVLQVVARAYGRMPLDGSGCARYLEDLTSNIPWIRVLSVAAVNGQIKCSTDPQVIGLNLSDRPHFQRALQAREFGLSDYLITRFHGTPSLVATFPAVKDDGTVAGVVLAVINLDWVGNLATNAARHSGASVMLIDGTGTLAAASADYKNLLGKRFADQGLVQEMLGHDEGALTIAGIDGVPRIFAFVRVPWTDARLAIGLDQAAVHSGIDRELNIAYLQLFLIAIFVLLVAWFGGEHLIVKPIRSLVRTATRFGRGDLQVRAPHEPWAAEFEPLAIAFDDMACKLAAREEELQIANQHLEELASLDGLTGLANRRGFDRQIEREWQSAAEHGKPLALMMIDIDHFKLYNDRYGHVAGDACLRAVGETLSLVTLDEAVLVARYGGEEFALLLPGLGLERAKALAEDARKAIEDLLIAHAEAPCGLVTISIGVESVVPQQDQPAAYLVEAADSALYSAKRRGRNMVIGRPAMALSMAG
jgi:diguanylate cyclase (GGDEF)-like protein